MGGMMCAVECGRFRYAEIKKIENWRSSLLCDNYTHGRGTPQSLHGAASEEHSRETSPTEACNGIRYAETKKNENWRVSPMWDNTVIASTARRTLHGNQSTTLSES